MERRHCHCGGTRRFVNTEKNCFALQNTQCDSLLVAISVLLLNLTS